jgi:hypothetical protein
MTRHAINRTQYIVSRVLLHEGRKVQLQMLPDGVASSIQAEVDAGGLALLPDGSIVEPVQVYAEEPPAHEHRDRLAALYPDEDFRVVMTSEMPV